MSYQHILTFVVVFPHCRFEKSFAGHYIGDLARLIMLRLVDDQLLFGGEKSEKLLQWGSFTAQHLSDIERSATPT